MNENTQEEKHYENPALTVDTVLLAVDQSGKSPTLKVLLTKRTDNGLWSLPGTFVHMDESCDDAVKRELKDKTNLSASDYDFEQLYTFSAVDRDPRKRAVTVAYVAATDRCVEASAGTSDTVSEVAWVDINIKNGRPYLELADGSVLGDQLSFDHDLVIAKAIERIANKLAYTDVAFGFLPDEFVLRDVQGVYEAFYGHEIDSSNFRKWLRRFVVETGNKEEETSHRPAKLYKLNPDWADVPWRK